MKFNNTIVDVSAQQQNALKAAKDGAENGVVVTPPEKLFQQQITAWVGLQESVNNLMDSSKNPKSNKAPPGIKQIMEKKEGLFRKHMMVRTLLGIRFDCAG